MIGPRAMITTRSTRLRNSRTFPGQSCRASTSSASSEISRGRSPCSSMFTCMKWETSAGMSSRRSRSEEHTSELQSHSDLVCRLLLEKKKKKRYQQQHDQGHEPPRGQRVEFEGEQ